MLPQRVSTLPTLLMLLLSEADTKLKPHETQNTVSQPDTKTQAREIQQNNIVGIPPTTTTSTVQLQEKQQQAEDICQLSDLTKAAVTLPQEWQQSGLCGRVRLHTTEVFTCLQTAALHSVASGRKFTLFTFGSCQFHQTVISWSTKFDLVDSRCYPSDITLCAF